MRIGWENKGVLPPRRGERRENPFFSFVCGHASTTRPCTLATLLDLKSALHWNLARTHLTFFGGRSRLGRMGSISGLYTRHTPSQYFFTAAYRLFDRSEEGR